MDLNSYISYIKQKYCPGLNNIDVENQWLPEKMIYIHVIFFHIELFP